MNWKNFDAIIFDLGGVLIDLDYQATGCAFEKLGGKSFADLYSQASQNQLFDAFETGRISSFHFLNRLLDLLPKGTNANQVAHAWDAMILDFKSERLEMLLKIKSEKPIFLLSNTNDLHMAKVKRELAKVSALPLEAYFNNVYLSQEIGHRKPNKEAFEVILSENNLNPATTLFVDDSEQHILGAQQCGIHAILLQGELLEHPYFS